MSEIMTRIQPNGWKLFRVGQLFEERKEKASDRDFEALSVTMQGIVPQLETAAKTDDGDNRKLVRTGDYVINSRSDRKGSGGISPLDGTVSLISIVMKPRADIFPAFAHHLLRSTSFQEEFYRWGHGIVADLWTTRFYDMKNIRVYLPDLPTQKRIASFLDRETARIDGLIAKKARLLVVLGEKRSALLEHLVSDGVSETVSFRRVLTSIEQGWSPECEARTIEDGEWGVLKVGCVNGWQFNPNEHKALPSNLEPRPHLQIQRGDILMSRANTPDLVGSVSMVDEVPDRLMLCDKLYRLHLNNVLLPEFAVMFLRSRRARDHYAASSNGASSSMQNISQEIVRSLEVPLLSEQEQRLRVRRFETINTGTAKLSALDVSSIDRLREYRASLITAAVTGQIDVDTYGKAGTTSAALDRIEEMTA